MMLLLSYFSDAELADQFFNYDGWWQESHPAHKNIVPFILKGFLVEQEETEHTSELADHGDVDNDH